VVKISQQLDSQIRHSDDVNILSSSDNESSHLNYEDQCRSNRDGMSLSSGRSLYSYDGFNTSQQIQAHRDHLKTLRVEKRKRIDKILKESEYESKKSCSGKVIGDDLKDYAVEDLIRHSMLKRYEEEIKNYPLFTVEETLREISVIAGLKNISERVLIS